MAESPVRRSLHAPPSVASIDAVQDLLAEWWGEVGELPPRIRFGFETAVVEVIGNIVEHGGGQRFTLELVADAERLTARFVDDGMPAAVDLDAAGMADLDAENGRGLALAKASVDTLQHSYEDGRNIWGLECRRDG